MMPVLEPAAASGRRAAAETAGAAACGAAASAGADIAEGPGLRACAGAAVAAGAPATAGAVTAAEEFGFSPGVYTGGSSRTVYSRINRPRAQFTSTRKVTNGSGIASVERTSSTSRPSLLFPTLKFSDDRNGGWSMP